MLRSRTLSAIVFLTSDLHWSSRVLGAAAGVGISCKVVAAPTGLVDALPDCRLVLIDLGLAGLALDATVADIKRAAPAAKVVAFGPHVDEALLSSARQVGCDLVLAKSQFHQQYAQLVRDAI